MMLSTIIILKNTKLGVAIYLLIWVKQIRFIQSLIIQMVVQEQMLPIVV